MAGQQSVNHYCIGLNDSTSHSTVKYSLLWFSLYTKPPYKSCPCATAIMYVTSARQVNNPQRHPWYDWQIHIVAASTYGTYFLDMHGLQTFGVFSTIKTHSVCFSSLSSLEWQPHPLLPWGTHQQPIDGSPRPWSLCPFSDLRPPYRPLTAPTASFTALGDSSLPLQRLWSTSSACVSPQSGGFLSEYWIIWCGDGYVRHKTQHLHTSPHFGCCISPV